VAQDPDNHPPLLDRSQQAHPAAATRTHERIEPESAAHQIGPGTTAATTGSLFRRRNAWGRRRRGCGTAIVGARGGDNARSPGDARTEHTVVQDQVDSRPRCQQIGIAITRARLVEENVRLQAADDEIKRRLEDRTIIERAKGILQEKYQLTEAQAYLRLRNESRRLPGPMRELAQTILLADGLDPESAPSPPPE
jgi:hypothetical protein